MLALVFQKQKTFFRRAAAAGRLAHAYLFTGPERIGKQIFALELAAELGGEKLVVVGNGIDEIRNLKSFLALTPLAGKHKIAVVADAHRLTEEAQNALLKVLEEPAPAALLILITAFPEQLLPTVLSRCQTIRFSVPGKALLARYPADEIKTAVAELARLAKAGLPERFAFAQKMSDDKNQPVLQKMVEHWLVYARARVTEPKFAGLARGLLHLYQILQQPQYNTRLAVENFLINL